MLMSFSTESPLDYEHISLDEQKQRGILGRLIGPMASFKKATRNGRKYSEKLWEKTFSNPVIVEKLENKCLFGELGHPADRTEVDIEKIAICLAEMPKKGNDGNLYGVFDILNTPNGRILKTMCDYGCNIGVSSRGNGDVTEDWEGNEAVDEETYDLECFDAVLLPAVKVARLTYVTESLDTTKKSLKQALNEALENANDDNERELMKETLDNLNIDYETEEKSEDELQENNIEPVAEEVNEPTLAADDNGAEMIQELQEALQHNAELESQVKLLQEKLSVCYTKEARYATILEKTKSDLAEANSVIEVEKTNSAKLVENLNSKKTIISELNQEIRSLNESLMAKTSEIKELNESITSVKSSSSKLNESINMKDVEIKKLNESIQKQTTEFKREVDVIKQQNEKLNESLQDAKKDSQIIKSEANAKLTKANQLIEKYKNIAKTAVDKYIESKAISLGISSTDIKKRLNENYSFNDIDKTCEDLQRYKLNMKALPFDLTSKKPMRMKINESKAITDPAVSDNGVDDEIDDSLSSFMK